MSTLYYYSALYEKENEWETVEKGKGRMSQGLELWGAEEDEERKWWQSMSMSVHFFLLPLSFLHSSGITIHMNGPELTTTPFKMCLIT